MSSQGIQDHFGAKSANWLASWLAGWLAGWLCGLSTSFPVSSTQGGQNEVETFCERWQLLISAVEKSYSIPRDLYFDMGQSLTPPHSGGCLLHALVGSDTSDISAETSGIGVKGLTPEICRRYFQRNVKYTDGCS